MVTYIHNASHFSARLVKCYKTDQKEPITYPSDVKLSIEIQNFFSNVENRYFIINLILLIIEEKLKIYIILFQKGT